MAKPLSKTKRKLVGLHCHPRQHEIFGDVNNIELEELAADMKAHGLNEPVEITSDGTIIAGHQRVRAARKLGWTEIAVVVRSDLECQGESAVVQRLIDSNRLRRQLDPLGIARACKALLGLHSPKDKWTDPSERGELRDEIGALVGVSGRTVDRLLRVLETPIEVQHAYSKHRISLVLAGKVAGLRQKEQAEIADKIRQGGDPKKIVSEHVAKRGAGKPRNVSRDYRALIEQLDGIVKCFDPEAKVPDYMASERNTAVLVAAQQFIDARLKWEREAYKQQKPNRKTAVLVRQMRNIGDLLSDGVQ